MLLETRADMDMLHAVQNIARELKRHNDLMEQYIVLESAKQYEQDDDTSDDTDDHYRPCATNHDYSPSSPWNAPGMSVKDFI